MTNPTNIDETIKKHFQQLPGVVQDAITSTDVQTQLRGLADMHKLHLDQWEKLENEVMMTLLGIQRVEDLEPNIMSEVGTSAEVAHALAVDINAVVFEPIRQELERQLEHPDAKAATMNQAEVARTEILDAEHADNASSVATPTPQTSSESQPPPVAQAAPPTVQPGTPPQPQPDIKITRPSDSTAYKPGETSTARQTVHDDPYRVPPV
ncbi:MAG: hypothetical protein WA021_04095 [Minisyncoccia bacterium]